MGVWRLHNSAPLSVVVIARTSFKPPVAAPPDGGQFAKSSE